MAGLLWAGLEMLREWFCTGFPWLTMASARITSYNVCYTKLLRGEASLWATDPWTLHVDGDTLIGRGVEDNQQAIVSSLLVAEALKKFSVTPALSLGLLFAADEETGSKYGLD